MKSYEDLVAQHLPLKAKYVDVAKDMAHSLTERDKHGIRDDKERRGWGDVRMFAGGALGFWHEEDGGRVTSWEEEFHYKFGE